MMKYKLWLMLAVAIVIGGGIVAQAFAGHDSKPQQAKQVQPKETLTASQKAARKRMLATAAFLEKNGLTCGCQHHFPAKTNGG
jgi:hypothetical protein